MKIWFTNELSRFNTVKRLGKVTLRALTFIRANFSFRSDDALMLETSAFQIFHGGNLTFINSFDKTKFSFERLSFFLEGSTLRHDQASNKTFCLIYRIPLSVRNNFKIPVIVFYGIPRRLVFLQLNTAPLVTSKSNTNQNTTRTTHNDSVRQQVLLATKGTDSLIHPMDDDSHRYGYGFPKARFSVNYIV